MFNLVWWLMLSALCLLWIVICKSRAESGQPGTESHRSINVVLWNYCTRHMYNNKEMLIIWSPSEQCFLVSVWILKTIRAILTSQKDVKLCFPFSQLEHGILWGTDAVWCFWKTTVTCYQTSVPDHLVHIQVPIEKCWHIQGNKCYILCAVPLLTCKAKRNAETTESSTDTRITHSRGEREGLTLTHDPVELMRCWKLAPRICFVSFLVCSHS